VGFGGQRQALADAPFNPWGQAWACVKVTGRQPIKENTMTVARVTEISATSTKSFEDAVARGVARATETLRGVSGAWVKEHKVAVRDDQIVTWQVNMMITFVLED
jgi:dodecin